MRWIICCTRSAAFDEGADRVRDLQFLRPVSRGLSRIGNPPHLARAAASLRGAGSEMYRLRRVSRILPGSRSIGAIRPVTRIVIASEAKQSRAAALERSRLLRRSAPNKKQAGW